jgi:hypothetical protein
VILSLALVFAAQKPVPTPIQKPVRQILDVEIEPNDQWLAVSDGTDDVWIYRISDGKLLRTLHHKPGSQLIDIEISPDQSHIVCTNTNWTGDYTPVWSTKTWKEVAKIGIPMTKTFWDGPSSLEYAAGGKYVVGPTMYGRQLVVWNAQTGSVVYIARKTARAGSFGFAINPNTTFVAITEYLAERIRFWDFESSAKLREWGDHVPGLIAGEVRTMRFSHDGKQLFLMTWVPGLNPTFYILKPRLKTTMITKSDNVQGLELRDLSWSADDSLIYVAGLKGRIAAFSPIIGNIRNSWTGHNRAAVKAVAAFHHGPKFVTGGGETVCIWSGKDGKLLRTITLPSK